ncbi:hypothetical protein T492DRAFT_857822 [Pavlovales sp. CCMP2436]|nr:hypothetical protein T492DRAFT_857822 [Pavlovales sp. CCMP2436]
MAGNGSRGDSGGGSGGAPSVAAATSLEGVKGSKAACPLCGVSLCKAGIRTDAAMAAIVCKARAEGVDMRSHRAAVDAKDGVRFVGAGLSAKRARGAGGDEGKAGGQSSACIDLESGGGAGGKRRRAERREARGVRPSAASEPADVINLDA